MLALLAAVAYGAFRTLPAHQSETITVTFQSGRSINEAAGVVRDSGVRGSYARAARRSPRSVRGLAAFGAPRGTSSLEGFLYPGSYRLPRAASTRELVDRQVARFLQRTRTLDLRRAARPGRTPYDVLIVASLVERETSIDRERPRVAAVIYNRLKRHMPLMIDATLRYAFNRWAGPLVLTAAESESPYDTGRRLGLPPTPIGNPGLPSLRAAAAPAPTNAVYYVLVPCGKGRHTFAATQRQFRRAVAAYNAKRDELGRKDPTYC